MSRIINFEGRLSWVLLFLVVLSGTLLLGYIPVAAQDKEDTGEKLRPELALVAQDAFAFFHVRPADVWSSDVAAELRRQFPRQTASIQADLTRALGSDPAGTESISFVVRTAQTVPLFGRSKMKAGKESDFKKEFRKEEKEPFPKDEKKPFPPEEFKKESPKPESDCGLQVDVEDDSPNSLGIIVTTVKPYDQDQVVRAVLGDGMANQHNGKTYFTSTRRFKGLALYPVNDRTFLVESSAARMKKTLDRPAQGPGPLAAALELAQKKHHLVLGLNMTEPSVLTLKKELSREFRYQPEAIIFYRALQPMLEMRSAALALDLGQETRAQGRFAFADENRAAKGLGAIQDAMVVFRILGLGHLAAEIRRGMEDFESPQEFQQAMFWMLVIEQAEAGLRAAKAERHKASVQVAAQMKIDLDELQARAKQQAKAALGDEAVQLARLRRQSANNLKQLALCLHISNDMYRSLPPAAICNKEGKPMLSWRVAILPYIEQQALYRQFKLDEPWDSAHNIKLLPLMPKTFAPVGVKTKEPHMTFYQAFAGPGAAFEIRLNEKSPFGAWGTSIPRDFPDGTSNTIAIAEAAEPVPWTKPAELIYDEKKPLPKLGGLFKGGFHAAFMDGSVRFLTNIDERTLRALITRAGGEFIDYDKLR